MSIVDPNPYAAPRVCDDDDDDPARQLADELVEACYVSLAKSRPWVSFISVLGLIVTAGLVIATSLETLPGESVEDRVAVLTGIVVGSILVCGLPSALLWQYARRIKLVGQSRDIGDFQRALAAQKAFWTYVGVVCLLWAFVYLAQGV